jgi:translation initiation factor 3 subunit D
VAEFDLQKLGKSAGVQPPKGETLAEYGSLPAYSKQFDRVKVKTEVPLIAHEGIEVSHVTTSSDPIISQLSEQRDSEIATVYATDSIMATIMAATRSVYSWDIVITRTGKNTIYLDKRPGVLELLSVNENSPEPPSDNDKDTSQSPSNLAIEATYINANFIQQVKDGSRITSFENAAPFESGAYLYRKWKLSDTIEVVARAELDASSELNGNPQRITLRAVNQVPGLPGGAQDWKRALDTQRGAVVATELRNNGFKVARWTLQALLADADWIKLGYVARATPRDVSRHVILGVSSHKPADFAAQMNLSFVNAWGILRHVIDQALSQPEGKYILLKDPNKAVLRLYSLPSDSAVADLINEDEVSTADA